MGKKHIVLVTGGQRSGKSGYAQKLALSLTANPVYLATSRVWDEEFRERVLRHQADRGPEWTNIEEEKYLSRHDLNGHVVVIDCVTLWGTNFFFDNEGDTNRSLAELKEEFNKLLLDLRKENGHGFTKTLREYSDELYIHTIKEYMKSFSMLDIKDNLVLILPLMGKIIGDYPKDYKEKINEQ